MAERRRFTKVRLHSKVEELSQDAQAAVNRLLLDGRTYEEIAVYLKAEGYDISRSSVGRYGKGFLERIRRIRIIEDKSKTLVSQTGDNSLLLEEAASKGFAELVIEMLLKPNMNVMELDKLMAAFAKLQQSSVQRERLKDDFRAKLEKTAQRVEKTIKKQGLTKEAAEAIRNQILGVL